MIYHISYLFQHIFLPKPKKCDKWHGTARHGTARHGIMGGISLIFSMKRFLLTIGRKIDLSFCQLISFHRDLKGNYPLYRVLERLSRLILSLPFRTVPGLQVLQVWVVCLNWVYIWTPSLPEVPLWFSILSFGIAVFIGDYLANLFKPWFTRIIGK